MNIIEKIEIKHFRSFGDKTRIYDLKDLNIISGSNDSGKSNILKALNLFFKEDKIDFYLNFNFENDFSKAQEERLKGQKKGKSFIEIKILFHPLKKQFNSTVLKDRFWITKRFYRDKITTEIKDENGKDIKHFRIKDGKKIERKEDVGKAKTNFLKKINFQYIPAIKDKVFFDFLKEQYQNAIGKNENKLDESANKTIKEWKKDMTSLNITKILDEKIKEESIDLFKDFAKRAPEIKKANFNIPYFKIDYSNTIDIETDERIPLSYRGDGIQVKFIPVMLDEIARRNKEQPIVIWAFEEPENSFEYKNAQKLANEFMNEYSNENQIFITTHSFSFLSLRGRCISTYRTYKEDIPIKGRDDQERNYSVSRLFKVPNEEDDLQMQLIKLTNPEREKLEEELGIYDMNKDLSKIYQEKKEQIEKIKSDHENIKIQIENIKPTKIFICEDSNQEIMDLWTKWLSIMGVQNIKVFSSYGSTKTDIEVGIRHIQSLDSSYKPKVFREVDRDTYTDQQLTVIQEKKFEKINKFIKPYCYRLLPFSEIENLAVILDRNNFNDKFWNKNKDKIIDKFNLQAESDCKKAAKFFDRDIEDKNYNLFYSLSITKLTQNMRDSATSDWRKYMPGKNICGQISNYKPIDFFKKIKINKLPKEMRKYLKEIYNFFEK